jgi:hypothetical protein
MAAAPPPQKTRRSRAEAQERRARAERLLGLFAWHRDAPLVARSLGLSLDELHAELDELKLRRKAYRLVRGSDAEIPIVKAVPGAPSGPPLRRRRSAPGAAPAESEPPQPSPPESASSAPEPVTADITAPDEGSQMQERPAGSAAVAEQAAQLRALLAEVGPRRAVLAERLGSARKPLPDRILLARFRAAGLEREFSQRERDLLRALFARHRGSAEAVAAELKVDADAVQRLVRERGLEREVERLRRPLRHRARRPR